MSTSLIWIFGGCVLGLVQLFFGIGVGLWMGRRGQADSVRGKRDLKRAQQLSLDLRKTTQVVASSVAAHREQLDQLNDRLLSEGVATTGEPVTDLVIQVVRELVESNQNLQGQLTTAESILQQQAAEIETQFTRSMTDPLTQLPNRRALEDHLRNRMDSWRKHRTPFSVVMLDVDHFKKFNDEHGHSLGDEVLKAVAHATRDSLRKPDVVTRYGGEEFAIVLPCTTLDDANVAMSKILNAIRNVTVLSNGKQLRVTASAGLATIGTTENDHSLLDRADKALYAAKEAGRNQAYMHTGDDCVAITESETNDHTEPEPTPIDMPDVSAELATICDDLRQFANGKPVEKSSEPKIDSPLLDS